MTALASAAAADLKVFLERIERLAAERKELGDDMRLVYAEAKASGFDPKAIRAMAKRRQKEASELAEEETILQTYMHAVGMAVDTPLYSAVRAMGVDTLARDQVIDTLQLLIPVNGEIIARVGGAPMRLWRDEDGRAHAAEYVEPKAAPAEKTGKGLKKSATVLTMVPTDHVKAAADAAERRAARAKKSPADEEPADVDAEREEPVE
jgi:uncharacterized protein (UPF0335 family)